MADHANKLTDYLNPNYLETLAAAYAVNGKFDDAVAVTDRMIAILERSEAPPEIVQRFRERRARYANGVPLHEQ